MLKNKARYRKLSEAQKKELCNGCGGKGGIVTPPHASLFIEECNQHDFNYFLGYKEKHRKKADVQLKQAMLRKVNTMPWIKRLRYYPWCYLYYRAVRVVGKKFFYYGAMEQEVPLINLKEKVK